MLVQFGLFGLVWTLMWFVCSVKLRTDWRSWFIAQSVTAEWPWFCWSDLMTCLVIRWKEPAGCDINVLRHTSRLKQRRRPETNELNTGHAHLLPVKTARTTRPVNILLYTPRLTDCSLSHVKNCSWTCGLVNLHPQSFTCWMLLCCRTELSCSSSSITKWILTSYKRVSRVKSGCNTKLNMCC